MLNFCSLFFQNVRQDELIFYLKLYVFHSFPFGENRANFIASSSKTFMFKIMFFPVHCYDVWTTLQTAPQPVREVSLWIIICVATSENVGSLSDLKFSPHQVNSVPDLVFNVFTDW